MYYYGARYYAAWTCRFISVDPLAADYPHLTPYNYAGNKPISDYDIDGMQGTGETKSGGNPPAASTGGKTAVPAPSIITGTASSQGQTPSMQAATTPAAGSSVNTGIGSSYPLPEGPVSDAAHMADNVYGGPDATKLTGGWQMANEKMAELSKQGVEFENSKTGFKSALYERTNADGVKEYAYATAGTDDMPDAKEDVNQALGLNSPQYKQSTDNARKISEKLGDASLTFIGHSLGRVPFITFEHTNFVIICKSIISD